LELEKYVIAEAQGTEWNGAQITDAGYFVMFYSRSMVTYTSDKGLISVRNQNTESSGSIRITMKYFNTSTWQVKGPFRFVRHMEDGCLRDRCG
jgi:hypothetical protein